MHVRNLTLCLIKSSQYPLSLLFHTLFYGSPGLFAKMATKRARQPYGPCEDGRFLTPSFSFMTLLFPYTHFGGCKTGPAHWGLTGVLLEDCFLPSTEGFSGKGPPLDFPWLLHMSWTLQLPRGPAVHPHFLPSTLPSHILCRELHRDF